ncbi:type IV secretory system conjugative DNA transfer family protein [Nesterenkonia muleiensis]|uniref:type IV secretory system conjugative DNA transfer family protein n=1 Tax=Nesterenkonia muleiensis TaxID=2282648 RepID=UPI000E717585|nr:type IV secretory system conjugative DNA transfer family protein [Nesterenkonia muleiensis]
MTASPKDPARLTPTMRDASALVLSRMIFPRTIPSDKLVQVLRQFAAESQPGRILLEASRTGETAPEHLLGTTPQNTAKVRRLLADLLPGVVIHSAADVVRQKPTSAARMVLKPASLPLNADRAEATTFALYEALQTRLEPGERLTFQVVLGRGLHPASTPGKLPDPRPQSLLGVLGHGVGQAPHEVRKRIADRRADYGLEANIRVGVTAATPERRERLATSVISALAVMEAPGVDVSLRVENPKWFHHAQIRRPWRLSVSELAGLSGLPVADPRSDTALPGMPPAHPKMTRLDFRVNGKERVFASSLFSGDQRPVGLAADDGGAMRHMALIAPTGAGKSSTMERLAIEDIRAGRAVVYADPKGDGASARIRACIPRSRWKDVYEIDPSDPEPLGFNPLDATGRDPDVVADNVLAVFARIFSDGWGPRTADLLLCSARTLSRTGTPEHPHTIPDIQRLWLDHTWRRRLIRQPVIQEDPALVSFWAWYESLSPGQAANVIAAPSNKLRALLKPAAARILGQRHSGSALRDVFRDGRIVLLSTNPATAGELTVAAISALVINEIWMAVQERGALPAGKRPPAVVYIDEADRLMSLPLNLADALQRSRSYGVGWVLAMQAFSQAPKDIQAALKTNARSMVVWKAEDYAEAQAVAKLAPELEAEDWMALDRFQAYTRLSVGGVSTPWALIQTLPPVPPEHAPSIVLASSRATHLREEDPPPNSDGAEEPLVKGPESSGEVGFGGKKTTDDPI